MWDGAFKWSDIFHVWNHSCRQLPKDCTFPHWAKYIGIEKKKNSSLCPWSWLAEEVLKEAIRVPCFSPCSIVYWVEEWSQNTFTDCCEEVLQRNLEPNKPLQTKWVWLHTHKQRPTSALWSFFQIGEGILEPKKPSFGQNGSDKAHRQKPTSAF